MNLQNKRLEAGLSQSRLAALSGVKLKTLQAYEGGVLAIEGARLATLINLSSVLGCAITDILEDADTIAKCKNARL